MNTTLRYDYQVPSRQRITSCRLSIIPNPRSKQEIDMDIVVNLVKTSTQKIRLLQRETSNEAVLCNLREVIVEGWPDKRDNIPKPLRRYWCVLVTKASKIQTAKSCIYWDGINKDLEEMAKRCPTCQELRKSNAKETLVPQEVPTRAWQILGTYLFHFNDNKYLIIADYYSKYPFVRKMPKPCTSHAVVAATKGLLSEQGVPEKIISDNGRHFDCVNYRSFAETWGFDHITSSPHYPQSNGFIERCIQTVKNTLTKARESQKDLDMAMLCLRTTPIDHSLPSLSELLYARKLKANLPVNMNMNARTFRSHTTTDMPTTYHHS